jgi:hypothetical protein
MTYTTITETVRCYDCARTVSRSDFQGRPYGPCVRCNRAKAQRHHLEHRDRRLLRMRAYSANAKARRLGVPGEIHPDQWVRKLQKQNFKCELCPNPAEELHHKVAFQQKGCKNVIGNVAALCHSCHVTEDTKIRRAIRASKRLFKVCNRCDVAKPIEDYYRHDHGKCKRCVSSLNAQALKERLSRDEKLYQRKLEYDREYQARKRLEAKLVAA